MRKNSERGRANTDLETSYKTTVIKLCDFVVKMFVFNI